MPSPTEKDGVKLPRPRRKSTMRDGLLLLCGADSALDSFGSDTEDAAVALQAGDDEGGELEIALPDELKEEDVEDEDDKQSEEKAGALFLIRVVTELWERSYELSGRDAVIIVFIEDIKNHTIC